MDAFEQLMQLNSLAFDRGRFESAYHALMAAMHLAHDDDDKLQEIERRAIEQGQWMDDNVPDHPLSTHSAAPRQDRTVYESAKDFAANLRLRLRSSTLTAQGQEPG